MMNALFKYSFFRGSASVLFAAIVVFCFSAVGCKDDDDLNLQNLENELEMHGGVPAPLKNPAGFCFESCRRRTVCRLGDPDGEEQKKIFDSTVEKCGHNCVEWIKSHPYDAAALYTCYRKPSCGGLSACLSDTERLLRFSSEPEKQRNCFRLCVDYGTCRGDEGACIRLCNESDLRIYRALERCENRSCPQVKECIDEELKKRM